MGVEDLGGLKVCVALLGGIELGLRGGGYEVER